MAEKIFVAMSGGVDSSVAALLLKQAGHDVVGVHMSLWCEEKHGRGASRRQCCNADDVRDAERVCRHLGIPFYVFNFQEAFVRTVVERFCDEYAAGRTPNPCIDCNQHLKFGLLLERAIAAGARLATGHYARIEVIEGCYRLLRGVDPGKDQSYFLYMLGQRELGHVLFPVGGMTKAEVRRAAREAGLPVAEKPDSVEVCFVAEGDYRSFVAARRASSEGDVVDLRGSVLGRHRGLAGYTIGQRYGVSGGARQYVVEIDAPANRIVVGPEASLYRSELTAGRLSWVSGRPPAAIFECEARIRYGAQPARATVSIDAGARVRFAEPQRAPAPGQAIVFYRGDEVLGGGTIEAIDGRALTQRSAEAAAP